MKLESREPKGTRIVQGRREYYDWKEIISTLETDEEIIAAYEWNVNNAEMNKTGKQFRVIKDDKIIMTSSKK